MAYNSRRKTTGPTVSPHTPIRILTWPIAIILTILGQPGMILLPVGYLAARLTAQPPERGGKDPWGKMEGDPRAERSYRRMLAWFQPRMLLEEATGPVLPTAIGLGLIATWGQRAWWGILLQSTGLALWLLAWDAARRHAGSPVHEQALGWAAPQRKRMLIAGLAGLPALIILWVFAEQPLPGLGVPLTVMGVAAGLPGWRQARMMARRDRGAYERLMGWLRQCGKPPVGRPATVTDATRGEQADTYKVRTPDGADPWLDGKTLERLKPYAQADGLTLAFAPLKGDATGVRMILLPCPQPDRIPDADMRWWLQWDSCVTSTAWHSPIGLVEDFQPVTMDGTGGRAWRFRLTGVDDHAYARDWLQGADTDLGVQIHMTIIHDQGSPVCWLLDPDWRQTVRFDDAKALKGVARQVSHTGDAMEYLTLLVRAKKDRDLWTLALDKARLAPPVPDYDRIRTVASDDGWALDVTPLTLRPDSRGVTYYLPVDLRPAFGDARVADLLPERRPRGGGWQDRRMILVRERRGTSVTVPERLDGVTGRGEADRLLARTLVSRALCRVCKQACHVGDAVQESMAGGWSLWRVDVDLGAGLVPADVEKASTRLQGMLGVGFLLLDWTGQSSLAVWAGDVPPVDPARAREWARPASQRDLIMKRLDRAWMVSGVQGADGSAPRCVGLSPAPGGLVRADFRLPAGVGAEGALAKADRFRSSAGYVYVKPEDAPGAGVMRLLMGVREPLPRAVDADRALMAATGGHAWRELPFGVRDTGEPVTWNVDVSPHLLVTGTTGFGKSSTGQVLLESAVLKGWDLVVCDPNKGANDFLPLRDRCLAFATSLPATQAALRWVWDEMHRRVAWLKERGVGNVRDLPVGERPRMILVAVDEFNSLVGEPDRSKANPGNDPTIANANLRAQAANASRAAIGSYVCDLAAQARTAGIAVLLMAQAFSGGELDSLPSPGTLKRNMARLFLGNGNANGNVSQVNVRAANALIRSFGDMPKGRGVYEETGRRVVGVQCWWSGGPEAMAASVAAVPCVDALDLSGLMPAPPKLVGVVEEPEVVSEEPVEGETVSGSFDWSFD